MSSAAFNPPDFLDICLATQRLTLLKNQQAIARYAVSTAKNGPGERKGSFCTPRGWHCIRAKIGYGQPLGSVFVARRPTGEIYTPELAQTQPNRDWILTRILWLGGLEPGFNRYGNVDTTWRYIYIHGTPDTGMTGQPESHGCIRMGNADVAELFQQASVGLKVFIHE